MLESLTAPSFCSGRNGTLQIPTITEKAAFRFCDQTSVYFSRDVEKRRMVTGSRTILLSNQTIFVVLKDSCLRRTVTRVMRVRHTCEIYRNVNTREEEASLRINPLHSVIF